VSDWTSDVHGLRPSVLGKDRSQTSASGIGVRLKVGINIEKIEGVGSGEGLCAPQLGVWGLII